MCMNDIKFDFKDKIVLVFGGSKGIGKEFVNNFYNAMQKYIVYLELIL